MRGKAKKWLARGVFSALVAGAMLVAGPQYAAARYCNEEWQPGTCPPLLPQECYDLCEELFGNGGTCGPGPCCNCWL